MKFRRECLICGAQNWGRTCERCGARAMRLVAVSPVQGPRSSCLRTGIWGASVRGTETPGRSRDRGEGCERARPRIMQLRYGAPVRPRVASMDVVLGFRRLDRDTTPTTDPHGQAGGAPVPVCEKGQELPVDVRDATAYDVTRPSQPATGHRV